MTFDIIAPFIAKYTEGNTSSFSQKGIALQDNIRKPSRPQNGSDPHAARSWAVDPVVMSAQGNTTGIQGCSADRKVKHHSTVSADAVFQVGGRGEATRMPGKLPGRSKALAARLGGSARK